MGGAIQKRDSSTQCRGRLPRASRRARENSVARRICSSLSTISESLAFPGQRAVAAGTCAARCPSSAQFLRSLPRCAPIASCARCNQVWLAAELKQVHGRRVNASTLAPTHLQQLHVTRGDSEPDQESECAIEKCFDRTGLAKGGHWDAAAHNHIVRLFLACVARAKPIPQKI